MACVRTQPVSVWNTSVSCGDGTAFGAQSVESMCDELHALGLGGATKPRQAEAERQFGLRHHHERWAAAAAAPVAAAPA